MKPIVFYDSRGNAMRQTYARADYVHSGNQVKVQEFDLHAGRSAHLDHFDKVPQISRERIGDIGERLVHNNEIVRGAVLQQASLSFPLQCRSLSLDKAWAELAEDAIYNYEQNPSIKGWPIDGHINSQIRFIERTIWGDVFTALVLDEAWNPKEQIIRSPRIGDRQKYGGSKTVEKDAFITTLIISSGEVVERAVNLKGMRCTQGVVHDSHGRPIAYLVLGDKEDEDQYISSASLFPTWCPMWSTEMRGVSELEATIMQLARLGVMDEAMQRTMITQSMQAIVEKNEYGGPSPDQKVLEAEFTEQTREDGTTYPIKQQADTNLFVGTGPFMRYFKAGTGSSLELTKAENPGEEWQSWNNMLHVRAFFGMQWDADFALSIREPGGNWSRAIMGKINRRIASNAAVEAKTKQRIHAFVLATKIKQGLLPAPKNASDLTNFAYRLTVPQLTGDIGREMDADLKRYLSGWTNNLEICSTNGGWYEDTVNQRAKENAARLALVQKQWEQFPQLSFRDHYKLFEDRVFTDDVMKSKMEAYGVGVRAGVLTPNIADEASFRKAFDLPAVSVEVKKSWDDDGGVRKPITVQQEESPKLDQPTQDSASTKKKDDDEDGKDE